MTGTEGVLRQKTRRQCENRNRVRWPETKECLEPLEAEEARIAFCPKALGDPRFVNN
jgi:hypothetical protein